MTIAFMLKLTLTGYTMHFKDINSLRIYDFLLLERQFVYQFPYQAYQISTPFQLIPGLKFLD